MRVQADARLQAIEKEEERLAKRAEQMMEAMEAFKANQDEMREEWENKKDEDANNEFQEDVFDEEDFKVQFDENEPPIVIPDEIQPDQDNDYDFADEVSKDE